MFSTLLPLSPRFGLDLQQSEPFVDEITKLHVHRILQVLWHSYHKTDTELSYCQPKSALHLPHATHITALEIC